MNTTPFMDKQIMDLTRGSAQSETNKDFIDLMKHPNEEDAERDNEVQPGGHQIGGNGFKQEDTVPSYDFQPIRPLSAASSRSFTYDSASSMAAWNSDSKSILRNYNSLDSIEPAKAVVEKGRNAFDATVLSKIDQTVKKHMENLHHVLEGVSARLTQLESRTHHLENSADDLKVSVGNNCGSTDGKMRQLGNILLEVQTGVQALKDKQDIVEAQLQLAKLQVSETGQQTENQATVITDPVQPIVSAPQQSQQHVPSPVNVPQSIPPVPRPNAPSQSPLQQGLPPSIQQINQFPHNQIPSVPQREPYFPPPPIQSQENPNQQYQLPLHQQPHPPSGAPSLPQYQQTPQSQYPQPATVPPQQQPPPSAVNPPQLQSSLGHHVEETAYVPSQNFPPNHHQPPSQPPRGPPPSQQFYGAPPTVYEPTSSRSSSSFSSGYGAPSGPPEPNHYGGSPQYGGTPALKPPQLPPAAVVPSGGGGYPQLPTAWILPHASPTASGATGGSSSAGTGNRVPIDDVIDKVASMGFPRDHVRATVRKLTENGQSVDLNVVLDKLTNEGEMQPPRGWFGR